VQLILEHGDNYAQFLGPQYNLIGFDPRGVNNSGPTVDCFRGNQQARTTFETLFFSDVTDASSTSLGTQFYSSDLFGQWCTEAFGYGNKAQQYISTPAVAQDMLTFAKAEQRLASKPEDEAELWYYGQSYGTVLGSTFASLFPNNVGRVILDGVLDVQDYYEGGWKTNLFDTDEVLGTFPKYCYEGGPKNCSFWGPSEQNITDRLDNILMRIKDHPVPVAGLPDGDTIGLGTYSDLKQSMLEAVYFPTQAFPILADVLVSLEMGNGSLIVDIPESFLFGPDVATLIRCIDSYGNNVLTSFDDFQNWVNIQTEQSKYLGDTWSTSASIVLCRSLNLDLPRGGSFPGSSNFVRLTSYVIDADCLIQGPLPPSSNHTSFPVLFVSHTLDPATPIRKYVQGFTRLVLFDVVIS
jgi:pimeloyl-ACP methyl ester carboxylesterase